MEDNPLCARLQYMQVCWQTPMQKSVNSMHVLGPTGGILDMIRPGINSGDWIWFDVI